MSNRGSDSFPRCKLIDGISAHSRSQTHAYNSRDAFCQWESKWYSGFRNTESKDDSKVNWKKEKKKNPEVHTGSRREPRSLFPGCFDAELYPLGLTAILQGRRSVFSLSPHIILFMLLEFTLNWWEVSSCFKPKSVVNLSLFQLDELCWGRSTPLSACAVTCTRGS